MLRDLFLKADKVAGWPLAFMSILALGILLERLFTLYRIQRSEDEAFALIQMGLEKRDETILRDPRIAFAPITQVLNTLSALRGTSEEALFQAADVALSMQRLRLRRYLSTLATIGSTAPFIGLFGTVLGVMAAFNGMATLRSDQLSKGISGALSATAIGLMVAIPSVMAYNFLVGRMQGILLTIHAHVAQVIPLIHAPTAVRREKQEVS